jgi:hypothetical protein
MFSVREFFADCRIHSAVESAMKTNKTTSVSRSKFLVWTRLSSVLACTSDTSTIAHTTHSRHVPRCLGTDRTVLRAGAGRMEKNARSFYFRGLTSQR